MTLVWPEESLDALQQHRAGLCVRQVVAGVGIDPGTPAAVHPAPVIHIRLRALCGCGFSLSRDGIAQPSSAGTGPPSSTTTVAPVALKRAKSTSATSQLKKGKTSGNSASPCGLVAVGLVDAAVAEAQVERLVGNADLARVAEAVLVGVVEDARSGKRAEPVEDRHVEQIDLRRRPAGTVTLVEAMMTSRNSSQTTS